MIGRSLFIMGLMFWGVNLTACAEELTIRSDVWPPFNAQAKGQKPGYVIEIMKRIFEPQGIKIDYQNSPWDRSIKEVRQGMFDCVVGAVKNDCPDFIFPKESVGVLQPTFYTLKLSSWNYNGVESLKAVKLGAIRGYTMGMEFNNYIEMNKSNPRLVTVVSSEEPLRQLIRQLMAGHIDTFVETPEVLAYILKEMDIPASEFRSAGTVGGKQNLYVAFSPAKSSSKDQAKRFDVGVRKLRETRELKKILDSYGVSDWQK